MVSEQVHYDLNHINHLIKNIHKNGQEDDAEMPESSSFPCSRVLQLWKLTQWERLRCAKQPLAHLASPRHQLSLT